MTSRIDWYRVQYAAAVVGGALLGMWVSHNFLHLHDFTAGLLGVTAYVAYRGGPS